MKHPVLVEPLLQEESDIQQVRLPFCLNTLIFKKHQCFPVSPTKKAVMAD